MNEKLEWELLNNSLYLEELAGIAGLDLPWDKLKGKTVLVSGGAGMIGSCLIDAVMYKNGHDGLGCSLIALGRDREKLQKRFSSYAGNMSFRTICGDVNETLDIAGPIDYILHLASHTHPVAYATDPIGTITANIIGTQNMLELAAKTGARFLFASSVEIYGENRGDTERFDESYCGYIDCNTMRAGYPESKRCGEALCQAYISQKGVDAVIARLPRVFGPTMQMSDSKAIAQFIKKAAAKEDIVLKSAGEQLYSYAYAADAVSGLLTVLLMGERGGAYNIAGGDSAVTLKTLAETAAEAAGRKVVFQAPDSVENRGYSKATKAVLDGRKLMRLNWAPKYTVQAGLVRTVDILRAENRKGKR